MAAFCEVALPLPLRKTFTYAIPERLAEAVLPGCRVVVPFRNRSLVGIVLGLNDKAPAATKIKEVTQVLDALPALSPRLIDLGRWLSSYYLAPIGEAVRVLLPPAVEVRQERALYLTPEGRNWLAELKSRTNRDEREVADHALLQLAEVEDGVVRATRLARLPGGEVAALRLVRGGRFEWRETTRPRKERAQRIVAWNAESVEAAGTEAEQRLHQVLTATRGPLPLKRLLAEAKVSRSVVERLVRQGRLTAWDEPITTEAEEGFFEADFTPPANILNEEQERAVQEITAWLDRDEFVAGLLHGVTGSGKTEVYLRVVEATLKRRRRAIVLVPEIALTLWLGRLFRAWFGGRPGAGVAVLHSGLSDSERAREWWRVRRGEASVVVGTRSAVFAPVENLGLVIVDEEQESSYKQEETPRYHGRDTAVMRAKLEGAVVLLGSATPSLETYHNARAGKYRLLQLEARVENRPLAEVEIVDLRENFRQTHDPSPISHKLSDALRECLQAGTQALVLINRRGYSWFVLCRSCGASIQCENCSISLTYHKRRRSLECHYCGFTRAVPEKCPKCQSEHLYFVGQGAEQVEENLKAQFPPVRVAHLDRFAGQGIEQVEENMKAQFPSARIARLDRDAARTRRHHQQILGAFASGQLDILVGTQMLAKGHDFERVTLVGVTSADVQLSLPDFRAAERTFQLLTQVAGRAGRGRLPGRVLVQTYFPEHYAIQFAARQDYLSFYEREIQFRRLLHYPPFAALANVVIRDRKQENAAKWARLLAAFFEKRAQTGVKVLGPAAAPLTRLRREFRYQFLLKSVRRIELGRLLLAGLEHCAEKKIPDSAILADVDPLNLL